MSDPRVLDSARLDAASAALGVPRTHAVPEILTGQRRGLAVSFRAKGPGCSIEVDLAAPIPDAMLRILPTQSVFRGEIEEGMTVDVITDDAAFDRQFHVEGAPSDVIRAVLDDRIRAWLVAHPDSTLQLQQDKRIRVVVEGLEPAEIAFALDEIVAFATAAPARAQQAVTQRDADPSRVTGYRALPDRGTAHAAHAHAQLEVAQLREEREVVDRRTSRWLGASLVVAGVTAFGSLPVWLALAVLLPVTLIVALMLAVLGAGLEVLGGARLRRWNNRRRRGRFERRFTPQLPPGDF